MAVAVVVVSTVVAAGGFNGGGGNRGGNRGGGFGGWWRKHSPRYHESQIYWIELHRQMGVRLMLPALIFFPKQTEELKPKGKRQSFFGNDSSTIQNNNAIANNYNQNHRFNIRMEWYIDSNNSLLYTPSVTFQRSASNEL